MMKLFKLLSICVLAQATAIAMDPPEEKRVVIVGGGMSGLTAGYTLSKNEIPLSIYEGRDRLGGRTHTHYFTEDKKSFYEEGGTFIDSDHTSALKLIKEVDVEIVKRGFGSRKITAVHNGQVQKMGTLKKCLEETKEKLQHQWSKIEKNSDDLNYDDLMVYNPENSEWHSAPLTPHLSNLSPMSQDFIQTFYEDETGRSISQAPTNSLPWLAEEAEEYGKLLSMKDSSFVPNIAIDQLAYDYTVKGGISTLINRLHEKLPRHTPIHLNHVLTKIHKDNHYVLTFKTPDGEKQVVADKVIMTLPFSTLRHVKIDDSVGLSDDQKKAIQTLTYGTNSKIGVPVMARQNIYDDMLYYLNLDDKITGWPGENALTLMISAEKGKQLDQHSASKIVESQKEHLVQNYPYIKSLDHMVIKNWSEDPFAQGSYSTLTTDHDITLGNDHPNKEKFEGMRAYAEPVGNFFFAGEHTRADGTSGYIEGAIRSGIKAAQLVKGSMGK